MSIQNYQYKTEPMAHQRALLEQTAELPYHAFFLEMGGGKTKLMIDNAAYLFEQGKINGVFVIAPNGVDLNWLIDEIPTHLPDRIKSQSRIFRFSTKKSGTKAHKAEIKWTREHTGLAWLIMSYDAFMTLDGKEAGLLFLEQRKCLYILDESVSIKTPGAKRTMRIVRTAHRAKYRRILDGYPTPKGAFDIYSQIQFLDYEFWKNHQWDNFAAFKNYFGVYQTAHSKSAEEFEKLIGFQHLEELNQLIAPISTRMKKDEMLDLPEKIYQPRYFELSPNQRKLYDQLRETYQIWLDEQTLVTANLAMVRMLRLQQISCGYLPVGDGEPVHVIEGVNPRLQLLNNLIEDEPNKTLIWAKYKLDIQLIEQALRKQNKNFVVYTGDTSDEDRIRAKAEFQKGNAQYFVGTPSAAGIGLTLHAAHHVIYYSNGFNLRDRVQSEDRAHRAGLNHSVTYTDLLGNDTIDKSIMLNLSSKMDISDAILGDNVGNDLRVQMKKWLNGGE